MEVGRASIPHWYAVRAGVGQIEVRRGEGGFEEHGNAGPAAPTGACHLGAQCVQELQLFRVAQNCPRQAARPSAEGRIALLRVRTAITAVIEIEDALMGGAATRIVSVPALAVVD